MGLRSYSESGNRIETGRVNVTDFTLGRSNLHPEIAGGLYTNTMSAKHTELSEQLANWWRTQADFKTKKALAGFLKVHPDTVGEYFSGKSFPRWDIAGKLFELTNIRCLKPADVSTSPGPLEEESLSGRNPEAIAQEVRERLYPKGGRYAERSVVVSLQRTSCPFCSNEITRFCSCAYCGQHFVWANVPLEDSGPM